MTFRGSNQEGRTGVRIGPLSQRELVATLRALIDASRARSASRTRDEARAALRLLLDNSHWDTPYVRRNIGLRRRKFIAAMGHRIPYDELVPEGTERLDRLHRKGTG